MATVPFDRVEPGDLITAVLMNHLMDEVESLETRLSALEAQGGTTSPSRPVLTARTPSGEIMVGSQLTLFGRNFLLPAELNTVQIGDVTIDQFLPFSDQTTLSFSVPNLFTQLPADLPVLVRNRNGSSTPLLVRVTPLIVVPEGEVTIRNTTPDLGPIETVDTRPAGYDLTFSVEPHTLPPTETYEFSVVPTNILSSSLAAWLAGIKVTPAGRQSVTSGKSLTVNVHLAVPSGATSADLALHVRSVNNDAGLSRTAPPVGLVVGEAPEPTHPGVDFDLVPANPTAGDTARSTVIDSLDGYEIRVGTSGTIGVTVNFSAPADTGQYRFEAEIKNPGALWTVGTVLPTDAGEVVPGLETIAVPVSRSASDPAPASDKRMLVIRVHRRNATNTGNVWTAALRLPIRGYA
jgi:hypothetical protein